MGTRTQTFFSNRVRNGVEHHNAMVRSAHSRRGARSSQRVRGVPRNQELPFVPPEDWHEPRQNRRNYRIVRQSPGEGYRHVLTPDEIRSRLAELPAKFIEPLQVVQLSRVTRKKLSFPCYGMQWGPSIYLYPVEEGLTESYTAPPKPSQEIEARMYGGRWEQDGSIWRLVWTEQAIKDFYLNNILIHELGHLLDNRNTSYTDRERYAEWFAIEYGYKPSRRMIGLPSQPVVQRHHR
jgi:hypothetical protein